MFTILRTSVGGLRSCCPVARQLLSSRVLSQSVQFTRTKGEKLSDAQSVPRYNNKNRLQFKPKDAKDWHQYVAQLRKNDSAAFKGIKTEHIENFMASIPIAQRKQCLNDLDAILNSSGIEKTKFMYDIFLQGLAHNANNAMDLQSVESMFNEMVSKGMKPTVHTFASIFRAISCVTKQESIQSEDFSFNDESELKKAYIEKTNSYLGRMEKEFGVKPNLVVYTNILQSCLNLKEATQVKRVFDACKFLNFKLDSKIYNSMLIFHSTNDELEAALDLYHEMSQDKIEPNAVTYLALAKACSKRPKFLAQGWAFLQQYVESNKSQLITSSLLDVLSAMATANNDLTFCRALFLLAYRTSLLEQNAVDPRIFHNLLEAYRKVDFQQSFLATMNKPMLNLRNNIVQAAGIKELYQKSGPLPPLLPVEFLEEHLVLQESRALWRYFETEFPYVLNHRSLDSFLNVAIVHGSFEDYHDLYEMYTYFVGTNVREAGTVEVEDAEIDENNDTKSASDSSVADYVPTLKFPRSSSIYKLSAIASRKFQNFEFLQKTWQERGRYRKCPTYHNLPPEFKKKLDFDFAREMVHSLLELGLIKDAVGIVLSTQNQFEWKMYYLRRILVAAEKIGDESSKEAVLKVARKYKPIDSQEYKEYRAKKGM